MTPKRTQFLVDFFGGASAPPPKNEQGQAAAPPAPEPPPFVGIAMPQPERRRQTIEEYLEAEREQFRAQQKALQEYSRVTGHEVISEAEFRRQEGADQKRSRDRGGGQSL
jgi:hypothetical protein